MSPFQYELERLRHAEREREAAQQRLIAEAERCVIEDTSSAQRFYAVGIRIRWPSILKRLALRGALTNAVTSATRRRHQLAPELFGGQAGAFDE
jgi:hypothetical protein